MAAVGCLDWPRSSSVCGRSRPSADALGLPGGLRGRSCCCSPPQWRRRLRGSPSEYLGAGHELDSPRIPLNGASTTASIERASLIGESRTGRRFRMSRLGMALQCEHPSLAFSAPVTWGVLLSLRVLRPSSLTRTPSVWKVPSSSPERCLPPASLAELEEADRIRRVAPALHVVRPEIATSPAVAAPPHPVRPPRHPTHPAPTPATPRARAAKFLLWPKQPRPRPRRDCGR